MTKGGIESERARKKKAIRRKREGERWARKRKVRREDAR